MDNEEVDCIIQEANIMNQVVDKIAPISECHTIVKGCLIVLKGTPVARVEDWVNGFKDLKGLQGVQGVSRIKPFNPYKPRRAKTPVDAWKRQICLEI